MANIIRKKVLPFTNVVMSKKKNFIGMTLKVLNACFRLSWKRCTVKPPYEPDYIAFLVVIGTKALEKVWGHLLKGSAQITVAGVFCHGSPLVTFPNQKINPCEIGDLLWCHFLKDKNGNLLRRNALLYQAKTSNNTINPVQLNLYRTWPDFEYKYKSKFKPGTRHITPSEPRRGAQYLLIDVNSKKQLPHNNPPEINAYSCFPNDPLIGHQDLSDELIDFLAFLTGDSFDNKSRKYKGWSQVIWDLLDITSTFTRKRSGFNNTAKIQGSFDFINYDFKEIDGIVFPLESPKHQKLFNEIFDDNGNNHTNLSNSDSNDNFGISTIIIETKLNE